MAVWFWFFVKCDASVRTLLYSSVLWTSHVLKGTRHTRPCITGHPVHAHDVVIGANNLSAYTGEGGNPSLLRMSFWTIFSAEEKKLSANSQSLMKKMSTLKRVEIYPLKELKIF